VLLICLGLDIDCCTILWRGCVGMFGGLRWLLMLPWLTILLPRRRLRRLLRLIGRGLERRWRLLRKLAPLRFRARTLTAKLYRIGLAFLP
ncbi:hypothetical protein GGI00_003766, partial [Coemansia sp. RSA 2681]